MRKLLAIGALFVCLVLAGCSAYSGENNIDVGLSGMLRLPDGTIVQGEIEALSRWSQSYYEVTIDGVVYLVHPTAFAVIDDEG